MSIVKFLPHNVDTYAKCCATLKDKHQVALVQASSAEKLIFGNLLLRPISEGFEQKPDESIEVKRS